MPDSCHGAGTHQETHQELLTWQVIYGHVGCGGQVYVGNSGKRFNQRFPIISNLLFC